jgi:hypothetical protein
MSDFFIDAPSGTNFKAFSCVEGFVKVSNINGNLRLTENLEIQRRISKSIFRGALKAFDSNIGDKFL